MPISIWKIFRNLRCRTLTVEVMTAWQHYLNMSLKYWITAISFIGNWCEKNVELLNPCWVINSIFYNNYSYFYNFLIMHLLVLHNYCINILNSAVYGIHCGNHTFVLTLPVVMRYGMAILLNIFAVTTLKSVRFKACNNLTTITC